MVTAAQMDAHYQRTSIPRNHNLPKPRSIETLPKLLFLSDPSDKIDTQIRIVQLTDLHNSEFGEDNQELIDRIASQSPDLILLTGDLLNSGEPVTEIATN